MTAQEKIAARVAKMSAQQIKDALVAMGDMMGESAQIVWSALYDGLEDRLGSEQTAAFCESII